MKEGSVKINKKNSKRNNKIENAIGCIKINKNKNSTKRRKIEKANPPQPPDDIVLSIITRLPAKSLYRFKCVSKEWLSLIQDQNFVDFYSDCRRKQHMETHSIRLLARMGDYYGFYFIDHNGKSSEIALSFRGCGYTDPVIPACNGLFCYLRDDENLVVWNPIATEIKILPKPKFLEPIIRQSRIKLGFGFDIVSRKYKLVGCHESRPWRVEVLTLGDTEWRTIKGGCIDKVHLWDQIIYLNGALYWLSTRRVQGFPPDWEIVRGAVEVPVPDDTTGFINLGHWLCELEGCLCLIGYDNKILDSKQQEWVNTRPSTEQTFYLCRYNQEGISG